MNLDNLPPFRLVKENNLAQYFRRIWMENNRNNSKGETVGIVSIDSIKILSQSSGPAITENDIPKKYLESSNIFFHTHPRFNNKTYPQYFVMPSSTDVLTKIQQDEKLGTVLPQFIINQVGYCRFDFQPLWLIIGKNKINPTIEKVLEFYYSSLIKVLNPLRVSTEELTCLYETLDFEFLEKNRMIIDQYDLDNFKKQMNSVFNTQKIKIMNLKYFNFSDLLNIQYNTLDFINETQNIGKRDIIMKIYNSDKILLDNPISTDVSVDSKIKNLRDIFEFSDNKTVDYIKKALEIIFGSKEGNITKQVINYYNVRMREYVYSQMIASLRNDQVSFKNLLFTFTEFLNKLYKIKTSTEYNFIVKLVDGECQDTKDFILQNYDSKIGCPVIEVCYGSEVPKFLGLTGSAFDILLLKNNSLILP